MTQRRSMLITGGAGFIGSNFVLQSLRGHSWKVVVLDKLTYAGNLNNLSSAFAKAQFTFVHGDINDPQLLAQLFQRERFDAVVHFAAESHVDRSIAAPDAFVTTNVNGTHALLQAALGGWRAGGNSKNFRFLHISTDEVYGSLDADAAPFSEQHPYRPNSPYAASKAASDHLVRAYFHTFGLPTLITNCSNNYGPYQFPEKLIPLMISNALQGLPLPVYGDGRHRRDWLFVEDHCAALQLVLENAAPGSVFNIGGGAEKPNIEVVNTICGLLDEIAPRKQGEYCDLIRSVTDRPGHDRRYAIDSSKLRTELGWRPQYSFETGIQRTVEWYVANRAWIDSIQSGAYRSAMARPVPAL
jgi:dTDP-glucose 4,6-dehydratase